MAGVLSRISLVFPEHQGKEHCSLNSDQQLYLPPEPEPIKAIPSIRQTSAWT